MSSTTDVCAALTAILRGRSEWDEEPCLYAMYREAGRLRFSPAIPEGSWPGGSPAVVLAAVADELAAAIRFAVPDLAGFAFRTETWAIKGPAARMRELKAGPRPSQHPDRIEQRFMWAVTCDGTHYVAMQNRGERAILARKPDGQEGDIPSALERMARSVTAGSN